ncbi:hypothetical protein BT63DRAFT_469149 [Microthyrium microscopicum]|uniref:Uncharacterized protein n=1 Tax=Microthyrium microscopicum TaxID=703497 RepID=A0A6A6UHT4_9PEZI|nr:hypothetical protein BT63DRAFT_469149 [Microthyrium microscopicum]
MARTKNNKNRKAIERPRRNTRAPQRFDDEVFGTPDKANVKPEPPLDDEAVDRTYEENTSQDPNEALVDEGVGSPDADTANPESQSVVQDVEQADTADMDLEKPGEGVVDEDSAPPDTDNANAEERAQTSTGQPPVPPSKSPPESTQLPIAATAAAALSVLGSPATTQAPRGSMGPPPPPVATDSPSSTPAGTSSSGPRASNTTNTTSLVRGVNAPPSKIYLPKSYSTPEPLMHWVPVSYSEFEVMKAKRYILPITLSGPTGTTPWAQTPGRTAEKTVYWVWMTGAFRNLLAAEAGIPFALGEPTSYTAPTIGYPNLTGRSLATSPPGWVQPGGPPPVDAQDYVGLEAWRQSGGRIEVEAPAGRNETLRGNPTVIEGVTGGYWRRHRFTTAGPELIDHALNGANASTTTLTTDSMVVSGVTHGNVTSSATPLGPSSGTAAVAQTASSAGPSSIAPVGTSSTGADRPSYSTVARSETAVPSAAPSSASGAA